MNARNPDQAQFHKQFVTKTESNIHFGQAVNIAAQAMLKTDNPLYKAEDWWIEIKKLAPVIHKELVELQKEAYKNEVSWLDPSYKDWEKPHTLGGDKLDATEVLGLTEEDNNEAAQQLDQSLKT